ncbi:MAG TPA: universal stress protein [Trichormus sp.]|jgi:nucleotide-binding universal stress UspA family protein
MKVIVPIDNNPDAQSLIDALIGMKWYPCTEIELLTLVPRWVEYEAAQVTIPASLAELEALAVELRKTLPHCKIAFTIKEGNAKTGIISFAQEVDADLILMSSTSSNPLEGGARGSVTHSVLDHAECPVFFARPTYEGLLDPQNGFRNVLVPVDDSRYSEAAMQWLLNFYWSSQTRFTLVSAVQHQDAVEVAKKNLQTKIELMQPALGNHISYLVVPGEPAETIIRLAYENLADLIVIGSHARTGLRKLVLGCVSEALADRAPCPVAVVRGILPNDTSWHRTGVFAKPKSFETTHADPPPRKKTWNADLPHCVPSGMH